MLVRDHSLPLTNTFEASTNTRLTSIGFELLLGSPKLLLEYQGAPDGSSRGNALAHYQKHPKLPLLLADQ